MSQVNITVRPRTDFAWHSANSTDLRPDWNDVRRRFWAKVRVLHPDTCWEWVGSRSSKRSGGYRYGQFSWSARYGRCRPVGAHRVAYELANGVELAEGQHVLHSCDNPPCVNPKHLFLGNQDLNMKDAAAKGRLSLPRKANRQKRDAAVARYLAGDATMQQIADDCGVHMMTVHRWLKPHKQPYQRFPRHRQALEQTA